MEMKPYTPLPHEEVFPVEPVGVRYICEFCNEGEMIRTDHAPNPGVVSPTLYEHKCTNCGKTMFLPKVYPYIEWAPVDTKALKERQNAFITDVMSELSKTLTAPFCAGYDKNGDDTT